jgi:hypothetical protein
MVFAIIGGIIVTICGWVVRGSTSPSSPSLTPTWRVTFKNRTYLDVPGRTDGEAVKYLLQKHVPLHTIARMEKLS